MKFSRQFGICSLKHNLPSGRFVSRYEVQEIFFDINTRKVYFDFSNSKNLSIFKFVYYLNEFYFVEWFCQKVLLISQVRFQLQNLL